MTALRHASPAEVRQAIRARQWTGPTPGLALGYVQANLVILPRDWAFDFLLFCHRNHRPCPLLDVTDPGSPHPWNVAPDADLRTDVPLYLLFEHGHVQAELTDLKDCWRDDFVAFLLGCSFTFEKALLEAGLPVRHLECGRNVPMFRTNQPCTPAGRFRGNLVVSMRPMTPDQAQRAATLCAPFRLAHGAPVQIGAPESLGIHDLQRPDFGDAVPIQPGEIPVFWACGVTPQEAIRQAQPPLAITHAPGHMFITDWRDDELLAQ